MEYNAPKAHPIHPLAQQKMKYGLIIFLVITTQILTGQNFVEYTTFFPLEDVQHSSIAFADIDGDDDPDLLLSGSTSDHDPVTKLYRNQGLGRLIEINNMPFSNVSHSAVAFADVDNDGDPDALISGKTSESIPVTALYLNDGTGVFSESNTVFEGLSYSALDFGDVDGDGDLDVLICGADNANNFKSSLYLNVGAGNFEVAKSNFEGLSRGSVAFADVDGDEDVDVLITGADSLYNAVTKLYINFGWGAFVESTDANFEAMDFSDSAFADVDGDGDMDVLVSGSGDNYEESTKLYINNGEGNFQVSSTTLEGMKFSSIAFGDVDNDDDVDVLLSGLNGEFDNVSRLYLNDGSGSFTELAETPFQAVKAGDNAFVDADLDGDLDVLITGSKGSNGFSRLYRNDGAITSSNDLVIVDNPSLRLFPNPTPIERVYFQQTAYASGKIKLSIYDMQGIRLQEQWEWLSPGTQTYSLDLTGLPAGTYLLEVQQDKLISVAKFIVQ